MKRMLRAMTTAALIAVAAVCITPSAAHAQGEMARYEACLTYADGWYYIGVYMGGAYYGMVLFYAAFEECMG